MLDRSDVPTLTDKIEPQNGSDEANPLVGGAPASSPVPFEDLKAPVPLPAAPPANARWLALLAILLAGALGALTGYGIGDLLGRTANWASIGAVIGGVFAAGGVGIVVNLTLQAMNEWKAVKHPEENQDAETRKSRTRKTRNPNDRDRNIRKSAE